MIFLWSFYFILFFFLGKAGVERFYSFSKPKAIEHWGVFLGISRERIIKKRPDERDTGRAC